MASRMSTDRWSLDIPEAWTAGQSGDRVQLMAPTGTAQIVVSDLQVQLARAEPEVVAESVRSLLDSAQANDHRVEEPPIEVEPGHYLGLGRADAVQGHVSAAAHAWTNQIVLLTLFQVGDDAGVRNQARQIFLSVTPSAPKESTSKIGRLFGRS